MQFKINTPFIFFLLSFLFLFLSFFAFFPHKKEK